MRAADAIVKTLEALGVSRIYTVPGESFLSLLDALVGSSIQLIACRHEAGAGFMAAAEAKMTGKPAVFMVSRGPGATNGSIALHMAEQDALPLIMLIGQVARGELMRGAFQEIDYKLFFGSIAKAVFEIAEGHRAEEIFIRAFATATKGTCGPVVLSLPEDMQDDEVAYHALPPATPPRLNHGARDPALLQTRLDAAERPLLIAGQLLRGSAESAALAQFAEAQRVPVAVSWKNQDVFDNASALYAGHIGFGSPADYRTLLAEADLIIAAGTRLGDVASLNYALPGISNSATPLIHIYPDSKPLGAVFHTDLAILAEPADLLAELASNPRVVSSARENWRAKVNGFVRASQVFEGQAVDDGVDFGLVVNSLFNQAARDCIITTDSGNVATWVHRHWVMSPRNLLLGAIAGSMGFGVPAAITASLLQPKRQVLCFVGDGGILMTGQEIAAAMAIGSSPKIVLSDNGSYGTIRSHQERHYPGRVSATELHNPDFTAWAKSFAIATFSLQQGGAVEETVAAFLQTPGPALLHVKSSLTALSAYGRLTT